jgi:hypothetical protein
MSNGCGVPSRPAGTCCWNSVSFLELDGWAGILKTLESGKLPALGVFKEQVVAGTRHSHFSQGSTAGKLALGQPYTVLEAGVRLNNDLQEVMPWKLEGGE